MLYDLLEDISPEIETDLDFEKTSGEKSMNVKRKVCSMTIASFLACLFALLPLTIGAGSITLTPTTQAPGSSVTVQGSGFGGTSAVGLGFGAEVKVVNEVMPVTGPFDVGSGPYIGYLSHQPIKPGTFKMYEDFGGIRPNAPMFDDAGNGTLIKASATAQNAIDNATMNYVTSQFTVFTNLPVSSTGNYIRFVNYTYYQYNVTSAAEIAANASGYFTANILLPAVANGVYNFTVIDTVGNIAVATLNLDNAIPEGLPLGAILLLSSAAVAAGSWHFRKRLRIKA